MTELARLEQRVRQLEAAGEMMREALVTALKMQANSLRFLRRDHPYAEGQIDRQRAIAAEVAGMLKPGGWETHKLASRLIQ